METIHRAMRIERHAKGPRVYVFGFRIHHGFTGCVLIVTGAFLRKHPLIELGAYLIYDDAHDFPWKLRDPKELTV